MPDPRLRLLSSQTLASEEDDGQLAFCPTERYIAVSLRSKSVHVLNNNGVQQRTFTDMADPVWVIDIYENRMFMSQEDGMILQYDILSG
ncbi:hypothetical protein MMC32_007789, partial [Xylographa parallela]|nr:hypothetical protein [Xylographa parallela]